MTATAHSDWWREWRYREDLLGCTLLNLQCEKFGFTPHEMEHLTKAFPPTEGKLHHDTIDAAFKTRRR